MRFFTQRMVETARQFVGAVVGSGGKEHVVKTVCGQYVERDGATTMWGVPGSARAIVSQHNTASKVQAEKDAKRIAESGDIPRIEIIMNVDNSRYPFEGVTLRKYTWSTRNVSEEARNDPNNGPHV